LIAIIPITTCTSDYLIQAKLDQAEAAVLYNFTSIANAPLPSSLTTALKVFGSPVYGIDPDDAIPLVQNMANYAGSMSSVPFGVDLTSMYDPLDYARLNLTIDTNEGLSLRGLGLFLLAVFTALIFVIATSSISMHIYQYRARRDLRRRVATGEIDLESSGVKRLTVPKEVIDAMPITIYGASSIIISKSDTQSVPSSYADAHQPPSYQSTSSGPTPNTEEKHDSVAPAIEGSDESQTITPAEGFQQSCPICLDDYAVNTTPVRHLPCNHIYHPHCIDLLLQTTSSLCPLCKRSVLPKGLIPPTLQLTNQTVARERRIRSMRGRTSNIGLNGSNQHPTNVESGQGGIEMASLSESVVHPIANINAPTQEEENEEIRRRPFGRRIIEAVFPYFTRPVGRGL
jgi:hypothetical protein